MPFAISTQSNLTMQLLDAMYIIVVTDTGGASASHHSGSTGLPSLSAAHHHARKQVMVKLS